VARPRSAAWAECKVEATPAWGGIQAFECKESSYPWPTCKKIPEIPGPPQCNLAPAFANLSPLGDVRLSGRMKHGSRS